MPDSRKGKHMRNSAPRRAAMKDIRQALGVPLEAIAACARVSPAYYTSLEVGPEPNIPPRVITGIYRAAKERLGENHEAVSRFRAAFKERFKIAEIREGAAASQVKPISETCRMKIEKDWKLAQEMKEENPAKAFGLMVRAAIFSSIHTVRELGQELHFKRGIIDSHLAKGRLPVEYFDQIMGFLSEIRREGGEGAWFDQAKYDQIEALGNRWVELHEKNSFAASAQGVGMRMASMTDRGIGR